MGSEKDFDFQIGNWRVKHKKLEKRLSKCNDWIEFESKCKVTKVLGGYGNIEDNLLYLPNDNYNAIAIRSFDRISRKWAIWWLDGRTPHSLETPVIGEFRNGVGEFFATDIINSIETLVRFHWLDTETQNPKWEQAFSVDNGATWETNWKMTFIRES